MCSGPQSIEVHVLPDTRIIIASAEADELPRPNTPSLTTAKGAGGKASDTRAGTTVARNPSRTRP